MLCRLLDDGLVENLVQQTFINAYEHLGSFRRDEELGAWLRGIAANLLRQELRRASRERRYLAAYHQLLPVRLERREGELDTLERLQQALAACTAELAPAAARAVELRYRDGRPVEAIAEALGRSALATRQLLFRARLALRACAERRLAQP